MIPEELIPFILYFLIPLLGLCAGSFILELADRIPRGEDFIHTRSHCESCGHVLGILDLFPVFSFLFLRGRCRYCKAKLSVLYPLAEIFCALLFLGVFLRFGISVNAVLFALFSGALFGLSIIDARTGIIPPGFPVFIAILGVLRLAAETFLSGNRDWWQDALFGAAAVSVALLLIYFISAGRAIGGGDIKLMAAAGLLMGWRLSLLAFVLGCILGSVIHLFRMRLSGAGRVLRMGPYLSAGAYLALLFGDNLLAWYFSLF